MFSIQKIGSWIRKHLTIHNITDKVSEFLVGGVTLTLFYIRGVNGFTGEKIYRLKPYEILKFFSGLVYLYLQLSWLIYFIDQETVYYLGKIYEIVLRMPSPFNAIDPGQAGLLYVISQILYRSSYGMRGIEFMR